MVAERSTDPLWRILTYRGLGVAWLARRIDKGYSYVWAVRSGQLVASPEFRSRCAQALDLPEWALFKELAGVADEPVAAHG